MSAPRAAAGNLFFAMASVATLVLFALIASTAASQYPGEQPQPSQDAFGEAQPPNIEDSSSDVENERRARVSFEQGRTAFATGDYAIAARAFDRAYATSPHHSSLWNAALSWERGAEPVKAANRFAGYLDKAPPDARDRDTATSRLQALSEKLGRLELQAEGLSDLRIDGRTVTSTSVYVSPGSHVVTAWKGSQMVRHLASVKAGELLSVVLASESEVADAETVGDARASSDEPKSLLTSANRQQSVVREVVRETDTGWLGLPPISFYAGIVITAALAGVTVWSGIDTLDTKDEFDRERNRANFEAGREKQDRTNVLFAVTLGAALLTGATALWLVDWDGEGSNRKRTATLFRARW